MRSRVCPPNHAPSGCFQSLLVSSDLILSIKALKTCKWVRIQRALASDALMIIFRLIMPILAFEWNLQLRISPLKVNVCQTYLKIYIAVAPESIGMVWVAFEWSNNSSKSSDFHFDAALSGADRP
ncbi:hypothetical protein CCL09_09675 [Pseudomonas congelans]|uniref:hypothetical protein n=1 Tax=Pseudomonas congelans TaxID=200452 RepID=UPI0001E28CD4|nr:hypothetical protein [Pseudomonas congelans]PBQ18408.1 hypothetical protein CCL09_09675 [Pseudomonas congelans]